MAAMPTPSPGRSARRRDALVLLLVLLTVAALWITSTGRWRAAAWQEPLSYSGDAFYYFAMATASAESHAWPFLWKKAARLGAPNGADWNDFPIVNEPLWTLLGAARQLFGLAGVSLYPVLLAHLLAALGFYAAARCWGGSPATAAITALLFALSPYLLRRSFVHLNLAFAWHLPLAVVVALWAAQPAGLSSRGRWWLGLGAALACGLQATYYSLYFLLLLLGALLTQIFAGRRARLGRPLLLAGLTLLASLAGNLDSLSWSWTHGKNPAAVERHLRDVEVYSLKPVELFLPAGRFAPYLAGAAEKFYYSQLPRHSESGAAYLGLAGGAALLLLLAAALASLLAPARCAAPEEAWPALFALAFATSGGLGMAMAIGGLQLFRAGNRASVLLLTIALLFAARTLATLAPRRRLALLALLAAGGLADLPSRNRQLEAREAALFAADAELAASLEQAMPGAALFQLPLAAYPEAPPIGAFEPYELLRLYSHSSTLRFSYGAHKGRQLEAWQADILRQPWPEALARLRQAGFAAIAIYRHAYADRGAALAAAIEAAGGRPLPLRAAVPIRVILLPPAAAAPPT